MENYIEKVGIQTGDPTNPQSKLYEYKNISIDSDHVAVKAYEAGVSEDDSLSKKIHDIEEDIPEVATASTAGIVKPGAGLQMHDGSSDGTLDLAYDHALTIKNDPNAQVPLGVYDGSQDVEIIVGSVPTNHSSSQAIYGTGDPSKYGHVKLNANYAENYPQDTNGVGASIVGLHNLYLKGCGVVLTDTLPANTGSLQITDSNINDNSFIDIYTNPYVPVKNATQSGNAVTLSFKPQAQAVAVKLVILNK